MPSDPRTYITVHDGMPEHPKIEPLSDAAFRLLVTCWCWCSRNLTDGVISAASWEKRGTPKLRRELIAAGLAEIVDGGVQMHDYLDHQRSAAQVTALRQVRADAGRKGGKAKANAVANAKANALAPGKQDGSKLVAESETDTEDATDVASGPRKRGTRIPDDFEVTEQMREWAGENAPFIDLDRETANFIDFWSGKSGQAATKLNWIATWRKWMRTASDRVPAWKRRPEPAAGDGWMNSFGAAPGATSEPESDGWMNA